MTHKIIIRDRKTGRFVKVIERFDSAAAFSAAEAIAEVFPGLRVTVCWIDGMDHKRRVYEAKGERQ